MALAASVLAAAYNNVDVANTTGFTTASISPAANSLLIAEVSFASATNVGTPVISGLGLTWSTVASDLDGGRCMGVFTAQCGASPGSGALTVVTSGGDATLTGGQWWIIQITGHRTTTPVPQFKLAGGDGTTATTSAGTLDSAIGNAGNRVMMFTAIRLNSAITPRASWTELAADIGGTGPAMAFHCSWRNDGTNETSFSTTFASARHQSYAIEIAVDTGVAPSGRPKIWTGSAWVQKPLKVWTGSAWVEKPVKVWTGSAWKVVT